MYNSSSDNSDECPGDTAKQHPSKKTIVLSIFDISKDLSNTNSNGNEWTSGNVHFECQQGYPSSNYQTCACKKYKVNHKYSSGQTVPPKVNVILGTYEKENDFDSSGTTFKEPSKNLYLFSIHPEGRVWSIGKGKEVNDEAYARIDFDSYDEYQCPHYSMHNNNNTFHWELLMSTTEQGQENWETNTNVEIECIVCQETYFLCPESGDCVPHCDGHEDCGNGSDEISCSNDSRSAKKSIYFNENSHNNEKVI